MTLLTKLYDNLLRINNQPLQLLYLMVMMIMVKMTTTMSESVTKYEKSNFFKILLLLLCQNTRHMAAAHTQGPYQTRTTHK